MSGTTDELTLTVGIRAMSGFTSVRVSRGIERGTSDFELQLTERFPGEAEKVIVNAGDFCQVKLGDDPVVTGFVDVVNYSVDAGHHTVTVIGRGRCSDLIDCSAEWPGGQISGANAYDIACALADPYGIEVYAPGSRGLRVQSMNLIIGESAWDIIERVCRFGALLAYEDANGMLVLSEAGTGMLIFPNAGNVTAASGFTQGENVQRAASTFRTDQRFSEYGCWLQSMDVLHDTGEGGNLMATATDPGITRNRKKYVICEAPGGGKDFAQQRITWEANRRIGRSMQLQLTTDTWRDSANKLWTPNTLAPLALPIVKCGTEQEKLMWLITETTFRRDESGTTCDLTLMPPEAFLPIPIIQLPTHGDIPLFSQH